MGLECFATMSQLFLETQKTFFGLKNTNGLWASSGGPSCYSSDCVNESLRFEPIHLKQEKPTLFLRIYISTLLPFSLFLIYLSLFVFLTSFFSLLLYHSFTPSLFLYYCLSFNNPFSLSAFLSLLSNFLKQTTDNSTIVGTKHSHRQTFYILTDRNPKVPTSSFQSSVPTGIQF